jgi:hypothetical protein
MGPCILIIFYYTNPNKMHKSQSLFYLTTALHVSGVTITHLQEHKTTVTTTSGNRYTVLLSSAIVEDLELIWVCCGWRVDLFFYHVVADVSIVSMAICWLIIQLTIDSKRYSINRMQSLPLTIERQLSFYC